MRFIAGPIVPKAWVLSPGVSLRMSLAGRAGRASWSSTTSAGCASCWSTGSSKPASAVRSVSDGSAAIAAARSRGLPDVIVLDVMLPGTDGFSLLPEIRRLTTAPVVMLTARTEIAEKVAGLSAGADDYVGKPFDLEELVARLRTLLRRPTYRAPRNIHLRRPEHRHAQPHRLSRQPAHRSLRRASSTCCASLPSTPKRCSRGRSSSISSGASTAT